jgi:hypothetical protein
MPPQLNLVDPVDDEIDAQVSGGRHKLMNAPRSTIASLILGDLTAEGPTAAHARSVRKSPGEALRGPWRHAKAWSH